MAEFPKQIVNVINSRVGNITQYILGDSKEQIALRNRTAMLKLVKNIWVTGVLEHSLHGAVLLELGLEEKKEAIERPWDMVLQMPDQPNRQLPPGTPIEDVFNEMNQRLLILGEPGSGKTTTLLELARQLVTQAENDPTHPIPVVFNLSSWAEKQHPFSDWLIDELNTKYTIPKKIARPWVESDQLLLLLDGLDEVKSDVRDKCVQAINVFLQEHLVFIVVCSRTNEYEDLKGKLRLQNAVCLQPLTSAQIDKYLNGLGPEFEAVRITLKDDAVLQELAQSPMMLSVMSLAYRRLSVEDMSIIDIIEDRRKHIFDLYIQNVFRRRGADERYLLQQARHWLIWLARQMKAQSQTVFLIERMQPTGLSTFNKVQHRVLVGLMGWLSGGLLVGLLVGLFVELTDPGNGLMYGMIGGLMYGMITGLIVGLTSAKIESSETVKWSWQAAGKGFLLWLLIVGLFGGLISILLVLAGDPSELRYNLLGSLLSGMLGGLIGGLTSGLITEQVDDMETRVIPNQGIHQSARNAIAIGLGIGMVPGLILGVPTGLEDGLLAGLSSGLFLGGLVGPIVGLIRGGKAVIQHYSLRFILYRKGYLPWNIAKFLDYATERIFLRKVGGGYMFIHRLQLEHFAELEPEQIKES